MTDIIRLLPDHIANQIAAGEVIQRPASVVKELLENALDAGADRIKVIIKDAGKSLIQVIDNGKGMTDTDARLSLERHATSKIQSAEDLFAIATKGFRGEALASIVSVSQVEMKTRQHEAELGSRLLIRASKVEVQEPVACMPGTDIAVRKLFFNIPARRKFLKSDAAEFRHIFTEFNRIALSNPSIHLELVHNDKLIVKRTTESMVERAVGVLGKSYKDKLIHIEEETEIVSFTGFVGTAESAKSRRDDQFLFINGRFFRSHYFNHAIASAYANLIQDGKHPSFVLFMDVDPARIDVNVHPTKQEIKFEDERVIYDYLKVAVRHALARHHMVPVMDFEPEPAIVRRQPSPSFSGEKSAGGGYQPPIKSGPQPGWESIFEGLSRPSPAMPEAPVQQDWVDASQELSSVPPSSRTFHGYLVRSTSDGLMIIDQRAAHIRVLYEDFLQRSALEKSPTQGLMFPKTIELSPQQAATMTTAIDAFKQIGFDIAPFGQDTYVVHGLPVAGELVHINEESIGDILQSIADDTGGMEQLHEKLAAATARRTAITFDKKLSDAESKQLVEQLFACDLPDRTPFGKPCYIILPRTDIDKLFNKG